MTREEYLALSARISEYNQQYEDGSPVISDHEYDMLMVSLKEAEKEHPEWMTEESPTQNAGAPVKREAGVTVEHDVPMLSIQDVFTKDDVLEWVHEVRALHPDVKFSVEQKIDGLSMSLRYQNGALLLAETRGDGYIGEDVTLNAEVISDVKKKLKTDIGDFEVRGEVYMTLADFDRTNEKQELAGKKLFANPRNCAAGTLRQLDPKMTKERGLSMFVFNVQRGPEELMQSHAAGLDFLKKNLKMPVVPHVLCETDEEIISEIDRIGEKRGELGYDIDGAVVKIDQIDYREDFPQGSKYSSGHIAYKYPPEEKETVIRDVEVSIGMTGRVNPTAVFDPIRLCGTTVSRATLHNQDFINDLHIGIGDTVVVYKSGEIIPKIARSVPEKRPVGVEDFKLPTHCPECGEELVREIGMSDIKCVNPNCPAQLVRHLINFVGRSAMDIKGFGEELIKNLVDEGYLKNIADIYDLHIRRDELIENGIIGREKNTDKLLANIEKSKQNDLWRLLAGLAIPNVGQTSARTILKHIPSIEALENASEEELLEIPDIGAITAAAIRTYFASEENKNLIMRMKQNGVKMEEEVQEVSEELAGRVYVITGDVNHFKNRSELSAFIESKGGKVTGSVSKKTTVLINNDIASTSGKNKKARELGIPILSEEEFLASLEQS